VTPRTATDIARIVAKIEAASSDPSRSLWDADLDDDVVRLGELRAVETIPLLVRVCDVTDGLSSIHETCGRALSMMGERGVDALLNAWSRSSSSETRHTLDYALAELGVRDERILAVLLETLDDDPNHGGSLLGIYGDPAALPALERALDRFELGSRGDGAFADHAVIELADAIEELGGEVSDEGLVKLGKVRRRGRSTAKAVMETLANRPRPVVEPVPSPRRPKIGRNERCWCGSGKKYKRCHLRDDARH